MRNKILILLALGCMSCTTAVPFTKFVSSLDRNVAKIESLTVNQLLSNDQKTRLHVEKYIRRRQCQQDVADITILWGARVPVKFTVKASVNTEFGIGLVESNKASLALGRATGSEASYELVPRPLSRLPDAVFENRIAMAEKMKDIKDVKDNAIEKIQRHIVEIVEEAWQLRKDLATKIKDYLETYPDKVNCTEFLSKVDTKI